MKKGAFAFLVIVASSAPFFASAQSVGVYVDTIEWASFPNSTAGYSVDYTPGNYDVVATSYDTVSDVTLTACGMFLRSRQGAADPSIRYVATIRDSSYNVLATSTNSIGHDEVTTSSSGVEYVWTFEPYDLTSGTRYYCAVHREDYSTDSVKYVNYNKQASGSMEGVYRRLISTGAWSSVDTDGGSGVFYVRELVDFAYVDFVSTSTGATSTIGDVDTTGIEFGLAVLIFLIAFNMGLYYFRLRGV